MIVKGVASAIGTCVVCLSAALPCPALAQPTSESTKPESESTKPASQSTQQGAQANNFPGDRDSLEGDHLTLRTNGYGFKDVSVPGKPSDKCAPQGSKLRVIQILKDTLTVQFIDIPDKPRGILGTPQVTQEALDACKNRVNTHTAYEISRTELDRFGFRRSGITFGGLVVPFKYRLGGDKGITSSSTVAPYVGFRTSYLQGFGVSFTPILSAGLGLVPVTDPNAGKTETKPAFSLAAGIVMTSSKNDQFNAGLIFGRDLLSKSDRALDPNVDKLWLSFYLGVAMQ
jgi:hypothetical protein